MKKTNYKSKIGVVLASVILLSLVNVYASEVTGTLSTGLGNSSVTGIVIASPVASPVAGTYTSAQSITLTSSGSLSIRYTTDGTTPTCATGTVYSSAISVGSTQTIKAISCYANSVTSSVSSFAYVINLTPVVASGGGFSGGGGGGGISVSCITGYVLVNGVCQLSATTTTQTGIPSNSPTQQGAQSVSNQTTIATIPVKGKVLGVEIFNFSKDLGLGSKGDDVLELQKILIKEGFLKTIATGNFGPSTKLALSKWQAKNKLPATGFLGKLSREFLMKSLITTTEVKTEVKGEVLGVQTFNFTKDIRFGERSTDVVELQKVLIKKGFLKTDATGYFGVASREAMSKWQKANNLPVTGLLDKASKELMNKKSQ